MRETADPRTDIGVALLLIVICGAVLWETRTIPLFIYSLLETPGGMLAARKIVIVAVVLAAAALLLGEYLDRRGKSRMPTV